MEMNYGDFKNDMCGYGIHEQLGLTFDKLTIEDDDDIASKYQKLMNSGTDKKKNNFITNGR